MSSLTVVEFIRSAAGYNAGERAAFPVAVATRMAAKGVVSIVQFNLTPATAKTPHTAAVKK